MLKTSIILLALSLSFFPLNSSKKVAEPTDSSYIQKQNAWVEKQMAEMTLEDKVGQLFMIAVYSNRNEADYRLVESQIEKYRLGGLAIFQGNALKQAELTNRYQAMSKVPLLIGLDAEWGLGMRLNNTYSFPKAITLGATKNPELVEKISEEIARQLKRIGAHFNFAPDVDINSNPQNPVINYRSFGESPQNVADLASAFVKGHKKYNIMTSAKHFPGHGDTNVDSHRDLPVLKHNLKHIEEIETVPFRGLIKDSLASVMIGHLDVPALDPGMPASVSEKVIKEFLIDKLGFDGLVISDALNMKGLLKSFPVGEAEIRAFKAGNDILLQTSNLPKAYTAVLNACIEGRITEAELDASVRKILKAKYWVGLSEYKPVNLNNLQNDINNDYSKELKQFAFNNAVTITQDDNGLLPIKGVANISIASLAIGTEGNNVFQNTLSLYGNPTIFTLQEKPANEMQWKSIADDVVKKDLVIASIHNLRQSEKLDYGITDATLEMLRYIQKRTRLVVCVFGNPYSLKFFDEFETVINGYEDENEAHLAVANVLFGVNSVKGKIPVNTLSPDAKLNYGYSIPSFKRLGFSLPSEAGMDKQKLSEINSIVWDAIRNKEFPGAQVLVARKGKVVYYEAFGFMDYNQVEPVTLNTLYDLASITKVASTLQAVMMLYDQKKLDLNKPLSFYLPELKSTNKGNLMIRDILLHQAGLKAFMPFYNQTVIAGEKYNPYYFSDTASNPEFSMISPNLYTKPVLKDSVQSWVAKSGLDYSPGSKYVYSDLGLLLMQQLVEKITGRNLDAYLTSKLFLPLGQNEMMFNPLRKKNIYTIAPTEINGDYRQAAIRGTVHDPNAALLGGIAGHAGLFSNAWDLAKLMQMNLNGGNYDEYNFFSKETIDLFTKKSSNVSHRGIGWNRPSGPNDGTVSQYASDQTYGHTGFTGTCVWADPKEELIFVFLSNRVNPSASNQKLITNKTRKKIHDVAYKAIIR